MLKKYGRKIADNIKIDRAGIRLKSLKWHRTTLPIFS